MPDSPSPRYPLNVVLDTNVVLDLFVWNNPVADPLRDAIRRGVFQCLSDAACLDELRRVLAYPKIGLDFVAQTAIAEEYESYCRVSATSAEFNTRPMTLPRCRDRDDQKFLELAVHAGADLLLTRDNALLRMAKRFRSIAPRLEIRTPTVALRTLGGADQ